MKMPSVLIETPISPTADRYDSDDEYEDTSVSALTTPFVLQKDPAKEAFEEIIRDAREDNLKFQLAPYRHEFGKRYGPYFNSLVQPENQTLLHLVANQVGHKLLTFYLIKHYPHLLDKADDSGKTPLYIAIVRKNFNVLLAVLEKYKGNLDDLLSVPCDHGRNSIHAAIFHRLGEKYTLDLIDKASEETLSARDQDGLTPLHLAVRYDQSSESQLRIVQALLTHGDKALDEFSANPPNKSVYEFMQFTRDQAKRHTADIGGSRAESDPAKAERASRNQKERESIRSSERDEKGPSGKNAHGMEKTRHVPNDPGTGDGDGEADHQRPGAYGNGTTKKKVAFSEQTRQGDDQTSRIRAEQEIAKGEWADRIMREIKLYYLRSTFQSASRPYPRSQSQALRFLHGDNIDLNLYFDYSKATRPIHRDSFKRSFAHMRFDNVLRYVAFNKVELQRPTEPRDPKLLAKKLVMQQSLGKGRTDLPFFFQWLQEKDVKRILKVIVDDWPDRPHSDKAIEDSLKPFEVENLEWRKLDICPETLFNATPDVRHLNLWWSGNRAILRAWSEPEGLARLKKLEAIQLLWNSNEVLESADVIQLYIEDFRVRLTSAVRNFELARRNNARQITPGITRVSTGDRLNSAADAPLRTISVEAIEENVPRSDQDSTNGTRSKPLSTTNQRNLSAHKWLNTMDKFADEIQSVPLPATKQVGLQKEITVALIDDGVNIDIPTVAGKVIGGATFDRGEPDENGPSPYFVSASGHGTVMADMICRVCPTVKLYVFKLETHTVQDPSSETQGRNQIVAQSAAQAVEAAVARGVDIISISWTVKNPKENERGADLQTLGNAIKKALDRGIVVFCAAGDAGIFTDEEYPYEFDRSRIIRIGAATDDGRPWERSGDTHSLDFIFPGCSVVSRNARLEGALPNDFHEKTGSSVATALAAGLAALILYCVRLAAILTENEDRSAAGAMSAVQLSHLDKIKDYRNMKAVFQSIGVDRELHKFIEVWDRFESPAESLRSAPSTASEIIKQLAVVLVSGVKY